MLNFENGTVEIAAFQFLSIVQETDGGVFVDILKFTFNHWPILVHIDYKRGDDSDSTALRLV